MSKKVVVTNLFIVGLVFLLSVLIQNTNKTQIIQKNKVILVVMRFFLVLLFTANSTEVIHETNKWQSNKRNEKKKTTKMAKPSCFCFVSTVDSVCYFPTTWTQLKWWAETDFIIYSCIWSSSLFAWLCSILQRNLLLYLQDDVVVQDVEGVIQRVDG